jgi:transposase InsO family protein
MHGIATMCRVLGVSPGGYYARQKRPPSARAQTDVELSARIAAIHRRSRQTYGVPRIYAELQAQGLRVGRKRVARLMNTAGLYGVSRRNERSACHCAVVARYSSPPPRVAVFRRSSREIVEGARPSLRAIAHTPCS